MLKKLMNVFMGLIFVIVGLLIMVASAGCGIMAAHVAHNSSMIICAMIVGLFMVVDLYDYVIGIH